MVGARRPRSPTPPSSATRPSASTDGATCRARTSSRRGRRISALRAPQRFSAARRRTRRRQPARGSARGASPRAGARPGSTGRRASSPPTRRRRQTQAGGRPAATAPRRAARRPNPRRRPRAPPSSSRRSGRRPQRADQRAALEPATLAVRARRRAAPAKIRRDGIPKKDDESERWKGSAASQSASVVLEVVAISCTTEVASCQSRRKNAKCVGGQSCLGLTGALDGGVRSRRERHRRTFARRLIHSARNARCEPQPASLSLSQRSRRPMETPVRYTASPPP